MFHLDDLIKLYEIYDNYAIVLISGKRCEFYIYNINETKFLKSVDESLPNQHKTGGQSVQRFQRIRDEKIGWYIKKIIEIMINLYIKDNIFKCKGLIIAGPSQMKDLVTSKDLFIQHFSIYLLKILTIAEITDQSIYQVIQMSSNILISESIQIELIKKFDNLLSDPNQIDLFVFGTNEVLYLFNAGLLKEIYLFDKSIYKELIFKSNLKTKIHIIKSNEFNKKYGDLIGIKYYVDNNEIEINDNISK